MCSHCHNKGLALALVAILCGCDREERHGRGEPLGQTVPVSVSTATDAGAQSPPSTETRAALYEGNAYHIARGLQLYVWMNCVGCHHHGGGGMGPALMDDRWRYGGRIDQIAATIYEGRPQGMPAWKGKLTEEQIWQLAAYVRTLSGQQRKDVVGARADTVSNTPPQTQTRREPILPEARRP